MVDPPYSLQRFWHMLDPRHSLQSLLQRSVMLAYPRSPSFLALVLAAFVRADARPQALLARAPDAVMLAYLRSPAFLARALLALVGADAVAHALFATAVMIQVMTAYALSTAFHALALAALVGADGPRASSEVLARREKRS